MKIFLSESTEIEPIIRKKINVQKPRQQRKKLAITISRQKHLQIVLSERKPKTIDLRKKTINLSTMSNSSSQDLIQTYQKPKRVPQLI